MHPVADSLRKAARTLYMNKVLSNETVWRYGLNFRSNGKFDPALNDEASRVLTELDDHGVAQTTLDAITGDSQLLGQLQRVAARLEAQQADVIASQQSALEENAALGNGSDSKTFVVTLLDHDRPVVEPDGDLARTVLDSQIKGVADSYYGMRVRVSDVNIWRNLPTGQAPVASQLWHRDLPSDYLILKMFIYLEDVTTGGGPFAYVKGTHGKGLRNWRPNASFDGYNWRASDDDIAEMTPESDRPVFTGKAGTVLFADTTGWHKGGHATDHPRLVLQALFSSRAALPERRLGAPPDLDLRDVPADLAYETR